MKRQCSKRKGERMLGEYPKYLDKLACTSICQAFFSDKKVLYILVPSITTSKSSWNSKQQLLEWLFQLDDETKSLHEKWLEITSSIH